MKCTICGSENFHVSGFKTKRQPQNCPDCGRFMKISFNGVNAFYCRKCQSDKPVEDKVSTYKCDECGNIQEETIK